MRYVYPLCLVTLSCIASAEESQRPASKPRASGASVVTADTRGSSNGDSATLQSPKAKAADTQVPIWLQGRASDTEPAPPIYSSSQIAAMFQRPRSVPELLRNLKLAWDKKLLVQPAFFDDANLLCFFNGTSVAWKKHRQTTPSDHVIRTATVTVDNSVFPNVFLGVQIAHDAVSAIRNPGGYLPAHVQYIGLMDLTVEAIPGFTWKVVKSVFGPDAKERSAVTPSPHAQLGPRPGKVYMQYFYQGDDASKFGEGELPQLRFLLKQGPTSEPPFVRDKPQDSDAVKSVFMRESVNRR